MIELFILIVGFFVAWNIGANDTANHVGVAVGSRILSYRRAIALVIIFVILGAILEGFKNMQTVGKGIIIPGPSGVNPLKDVPQAALSAMLAASIWVFIATVLGLPISTSQSMVGGVIGAGLVITMAHPDIGATIQYSKLGAIAVSWVLNPLLAALWALLISKAVTQLLRRIKNIVLFNQVLSALVIIASAYSAYVMGANDVGTSTGAIYGSLGGSMELVAFFGAVALCVGTITFSRRVIHTVGTGITELHPATAFAAQFATALTVWSFVQFGMPVSTSQAIVGGVAGAGLAKGAGMVSKKKLFQIFTAWVVTPLVACALSLGFGWLLLR
ncbi:MAG: inorganic phosphate transporter [Candidatus Hadarchaeales archaeon]